jgi:hypothetical protein
MKKKSQQLRSIDSNALASVSGGIGIRKAINLLQAINQSDLSKETKRYLRQEVKSAIDLGPTTPTTGYGY